MIKNNIKQHNLIYRTDDGEFYYVGRHGTDNLNDGYDGSGTWVTEHPGRDEMDTRIYEVVDFTDEVTGEEVKMVMETREGQYLRVHYGREGCKNRTPQSKGWVAGGPNAMHDPEVAAKISGDNHYMRKDPEAREASRVRQNELVAKGDHFFQSDDHPNKDGSCVKKAIENGNHINLGERNPSKTRSKNGTHQMFRREDGTSIGGDANEKRIAAGTHNFLGPDNNQARIDANTHNFQGSTQNEKMLAEGTHPSQKKVKCPTCGWTVSSGMFKRWHSVKDGVPQCHLDPHSPRYNPDLKPR